MAAPTITSVYPADQAVGVILGGPIVVTFSSLMNHSTITTSTFAMIAPEGTMIITPENEIQQNPSPVSGKVVLPGTFTFDDGSGVTIASFFPSALLAPNTIYQLMVIGSSAYLLTSPVKDTSGNALAANYSWSFTTGTLNLVTPPVTSPLVSNNPDIDPLTDIVVLPRTFPNPNGTSLTQEIDIVFPDDIDPSSFDPSDLLLSVDAILGDPSVVVPSGLHTTATIVGNMIKITITGWPA